ncbi:MAG TPA: hypothetical protein VIX41_11515 [Acidimicrobiales bacterium]
MTARLTAAEARQLGLIVKDTARKKVRREAKGAYHTRCTHCEATFDTVTGEDRHLAFNPTHTRFELVLGPDPRKETDDRRDT